MAYTAVVTGSSGFLATQLVKDLLEKGYNVRGTVRSLANKEKVEHLIKLGEALPGKLELFEADLLKDGSFDAAIAGSDYVFHTASPFLNAVGDPQRDLIEPALLGTKNVLTSVAKHKSSIKRVVLTSSFAAVNKAKKGPFKPPRYTEEDWNDEATVETAAYRLSKTLAEQAAWDMAKKEGFDLVVINPTLVIGPIISARTDATSIKNVKALIECESEQILSWLCDVRDISRGHILAAENESAQGRYIISQPDTVPTRIVLDALKKRFPHYKFLDGKDEEPQPLLDNTKALKELGLSKLHDPADSIVDMAVTLIQNGVAKPQLA